MDELTTRYLQRRTRTLLEHTPNLLVNILSDVAPGAGGNQGGRVSGGGDKASLPLNTTALEDGNRTYGQLVDWATSHAAALGIVPPVTTLAWARRQRDCDGFPSWADRPELVHSLTKDVTDWLAAYDWAISGLDVAATYWGDILDIVGPLMARYRPQVKVQVTAAEDCPICARRRTVIVNEADDGEVVVACTFCGYVVPHDFRAKYLAWKVEDETRALEWR